MNHDCVQTAPVGANSLGADFSMVVYQLAGEGHIYYGVMQIFSCGAV